MQYVSNIFLTMNLIAYMNIEEYKKRSSRTAQRREVAGIAVMKDAESCSTAQHPREVGKVRRR